MSGSIQRVQAANIDGRARSPRFIQNQLKVLHDLLVKSVQDIHSAIGKDSGNTSAEIGIEYYLALSCVKEQYASIDVEKFVEEEYRIANSKDAPTRRIAAGIVYVVPSRHTLFYSVIVPLCTAIAAGNCIVLELGTTLSEVNSLLRKLLPQALDNDTFAIVESRPSDNIFMSSCVQVLSNDTTDQTLPTTLITSPSNSRVIAIVDRSADVNIAASALVGARFGFSGRSPYAPDVVLVNEFVMEAFSLAVVEQATKYFSKVTMNGSARGDEKYRNSSKWLTDEENREDGITVVVSGANGSIVRVNERTSNLLQNKITKPILTIHAISSLDDGIDFSNASGKPLLATYIFAAPASAKYISQFTNAHVTFTNHLPVELLVGPAYPLSYPVSTLHRYTQTMFSTPRPQFTLPRGLPPQALNAAKEDAELRRKALQPLPQPNQRDGAAIGFFEQGVMVGAAVLVMPVVVGVVTLGVWGLREGLRRWRGLSG